MPFTISFSRPIFFHIYEIPVYSYGICLSLAFFIILYLLENRLKSDHRLCLIKPDYLILYSSIGGIIGAKILFILSHIFSSGNIDIFQAFFSSGGLSFQGGALGGILSSWIYVSLYLKLEYIFTFNRFCHFIGLGHAIGKIGCFLSGDGCYGVPTSLPWGMSFPNGLVPTIDYVHPVPLYEAICSLSIFILREYCGKLQKISSFFISMCIVRFFLEFVRDHPIVYIGLTEFQLYAILIIVLFTIIPFDKVLKTKAKIS